MGTIVGLPCRACRACLLWRGQVQGPRPRHDMTGPVSNRQPLPIPLQGQDQDPGIGRKPEQRVTWSARWESSHQVS